MALADALGYNAASRVVERAAATIAFRGSRGNVSGIVRPLPSVAPSVARDAFDEDYYP